MHLIFTETGFMFLPGWLGLSPLSPPGYSHIRSVHTVLQGREAGKRSSLLFSHSVQAACTLARCVNEEKNRQTSSDVVQSSTANRWASAQTCRETSADYWMGGWGLNMRNWSRLISWKRCWCSRGPPLSYSCKVWWVCLYYCKMYAKGSKIHYKWN